SMPAAVRQVSLPMRSAFRSIRPGMKVGTARRHSRLSKCSYGEEGVYPRAEVGTTLADSKEKAPAGRLGDVTAGAQGLPLRADHAVGRHRSDSETSATGWTADALRATLTLRVSPTRSCLYHPAPPVKAGLFLA